MKTVRPTSKPSAKPSVRPTIVPSRKPPHKMKSSCIFSLPYVHVAYTKAIESKTSQRA